MSTVTQSSMAQHIVLDGLPGNITPDKRETFLHVFKSQIAKRLGHDGFELFLATGPDGLVNGAFVMFQTVDFADRAVASLNKWRFTKAVEIRAYYWSDFDKYSSVPDQFVPPRDDLGEKQGADATLDPFLIDPEARPQFVIKAGEHFDLEWYWFDTAAVQPRLIRKPNDSRDDACAQWTEMDRRARRLTKGIPKDMPLWSPQGSFLVTQHPDGIRFWGGKGLRLSTELLSDEISKMFISADERYVILFAREFSFWNIADGRKIRSLAGICDDECPYKYNADESCVGIANCDLANLCFYSAATMKLLSPKLAKYTLNVPGLRSFEWSPTDPSIFACVVAGSVNEGWRVEVSTIDCATGAIQNLTRRNVFSADNIGLKWQSSGALLAAKVQKTLKGEHIVEYLLLKVFGTAVSSLHFDPKREPLRLAFAQADPIFSVLLGEVRGGEKQAIAFFSVGNTGCNAIGTPFVGDGESVFWSPKRTHCVGVNLKKFSLDFFVLEGNQARCVGHADHIDVEHVLWDPSGRFVCSCVTAKSQVAQSHGFRIWNAFGDLLCESVRERFSHFLWRPLPKTVLSQKQLDNIHSTMPARIAKFAKEEEKERKTSEDVKKKQKKNAEKSFCDIMDNIAAHHAKHKWKEAREQLQASALAMRQAKKLIQTLEPVTETVTKVEIISETPILRDEAQTKVVDTKRLIFNASA